MDTAAARPVWWSVSVALCVVAVVLSGAFIGAYLDNGQDIALIRNALVYEISDNDAVFVAAPDGAPTGAAGDTPWRAIAQEAGALDAGQDDLQRALAIVRHLDRPGPPLGGMIALPSLDTYRSMRGSGRGYCADYTQVFLAIAAAAGLSAREWGISFAGYSGAGHAVIEIYARQLQRWIMLDVFNGFYVTDQTQQPLSLPAVRETLHRGDPQRLQVQVIGDVLPFPSPERALHYLARGMPRAYLWRGSEAVAGLGATTLDSISRHSRALAQLLAMVTGHAPRMLLMPAPEQRSALLELRLLRVACIAVFAATLLLVTLLGWHTRQRAVQASGPHGTT